MVAYAANTCHPENTLKSSLCFAWVTEHHLVMTLISIFLGCVWQVQCFWSPTTLTSPLAHQTPEEAFSMGDNTSSYMISLQKAFGFLSEKPRHKHCRITNHMSIYSKEYFRGIFTLLFEKVKII